jgi:hypothetical protein
MVSTWRLMLLGLLVALFGHAASENAIRARQMEKAGDTAGAKELLRRAAASSSASADDLAAWAEFLDRKRDPGARAAYERLLAVAPAADKARVARRLMVLDLLNEDIKSAETHLGAYRAAGSTDLKIPVYTKTEAPWPTVDIPGPLRSFNRMAALSPELPPADVVGAIARNIVTNGYQAASSNEALEQTEYLKLIIRYLSQARELEKLTGPDKVMKVENCESPVTADLLKVLGYRMRGGCGSDVVLETVNATRAFLTIDSGFPLSDLEVALRTNKPFTYDYAPSKVPVLYGPEYWLSSREKNAENKAFIDLFLEDPSLCRLYLGLSKLDRETAEELKKAMPASRIRAFAHVLDFYGAMFQIRNGKAVVPGPAASWQEFTGASPDQGAAFFEKLIARDDGWLASYFDGLMRIQGTPTYAYLTEPARLKRYYTAIRGRLTSPGPARPVFRANTDMMLLTNRLRLEPDGRPHVPGGVAAWKNLFVTHPHGKYDGKLTKSAAGWKEPDEVVEALFALSRKAVENDPLKMYMMLSDVNRRRAQPFTPAMVERLLKDYKLFSAQYPLFAEVPDISEKTVNLYLDAATAVNQVRDVSAKAEEAGMLQALTGLWQILARQNLIPASAADATLAEMLGSFATIKNSRDLFDAGRNGVQALAKAAGATGADPQEQMLNLMAGQAKPSEDDSHFLIVEDMKRIFESQRLISLKTIFDLADNLTAVSKGEKMNTALVNRLSARIQETQPPRSSLTGAEKNAMAFGYWVDKHIEGQRKVNFRQIVEKSATDPERLKEARGLLAQFLRDTLVGFNYIHYAPPGAQILMTNPHFVRSHDFIGIQSSNQTWKQTEVFGTGWPSSAGGRLVGSLAGLPYALAESEQNFLIPTREQALIWGDLVPQMILSAKIPRFWNVTSAQMHWLALHLRAGESFLAEAVIDEKRREQVLNALERQAAPARAREVAQLLFGAQVRSALDLVTPSELFAIARQVVRQDTSAGDAISAEIRRMAAETPDSVSYAAISRAFGTPKPTLAASYTPELLNLRTFPTLMGYSSRILAESWESSNLYYAALADEMQLAPSQLNVVIPQWTQKTVERIFATHLEDWPALLRSLRLVGDDIRADWRKQMAVQQKAALQ